MVLGKSIQIAVSIQVKNSRGQTILPLIEITLQAANLDCVYTQLYKDSLD